MNSDYQSVFVRYERTGNTVTPVRIVKGWVESDDGPAFVTVHETVLRWDQIRCFRF